MVKITADELVDTKISSGSEVIDWLLEGGYEKDVLTCIYGSPGVGKTNLLLLLLAKSPDLQGKKVLFIDTEGNFSLSRFKQLAKDYDEILKRTIFLRPVNFSEQRKAFERLRTLVTNKIGAIILDSVAMLYRLELGKDKDVYNVNRDLGLQLSYLTEIARKKKIPIIVTNQVYADIEKERGIKMVGGDILRYSSKCLIELRKNDDNSRTVILRKHRSLPEQQIDFKITDEGIEEIKNVDGT